MQTAWIAAEACKIKDGVFMGNVMAVQDSGFILSNKICTVIKCQKGFTVPKRLRNAGVQYSVINLLEAFLDDTISDDTKDHMLEGLYAVVDEACDNGVGVLFYCFQDFVWCAFCILAYVQPPPPPPPFPGSTTIPLNAAFILPTPIPSHHRRCCAPTLSFSGTSSASTSGPPTRLGSFSR